MSFTKTLFLVIILIYSCKTSRVTTDEENEDLTICAYCGYGGSLDLEFNIVKHQYLIKDTSSLQNQFENSSGRLKLFSALCINQLIINNSFHPNEKLQSDLNSYKRSKEKIRIYEACTESFQTTIWSLFHDKNDSVNEIITNILFNP